MDKLKVSNTSSWVSVTTLAIVFVTSIYNFGFRDSEIFAAIDSLKAEDVRIYKSIDDKTKDRVYGQTVAQMFANHQTQLDNLKESSEDKNDELKQRLERMDSRIQETNALLQEALKEIRKIPHAQR